MSSEEELVLASRAFPQSQRDVKGVCRRCWGCWGVRPSYGEAWLAPFQLHPEHLSSGRAPRLGHEHGQGVGLAGLRGGRGFLNICRRR
eukprot:scaffold602_cov298-Pinguiococcus_pyrenoidosus.AAC.28